MIKFPLLKQVFTLRSNRIYQFTLHGDKLYGIYLGGLFQSFTKTSALVLIFTVLLSFGLTTVPFFILPEFVRNFYDSFLDTILFLTFYSFLYWNITESVDFINAKISVEKIEKWQKYDKISKGHLKLIEDNNDAKFKQINKRNIVIDLIDIRDVSTSATPLELLSFHKHYGQINLTLKNGNKNEVSFDQR